METQKEFSKRLGRTLDKSKELRKDIEEEGLKVKVDIDGIERTLEWHGGHTVNIYNEEGQEIEIRNIGDFASDKVPVDEFLSTVYDFKDREEKKLKDIV